jgi:transposase
LITDEARFVRRLDIIALICDGHSTNHVASFFGIHPTTVQRWIHRLNKSGIEGLRDRPGKGRRPLLKNANRVTFEKDLAKSPKDFGYNQRRWKGKLLSHHLKLHYGIDLKERQCQNLIRKFK